ncbi:MAG: hypothetical protein PQJ58_07910 [Spirochaetales bacterium]|nr:hypothetical protein [Spirochaetales bacterium]
MKRKVLTVLLYCVLLLPLQAFNLSELSLEELDPDQEQELYEFFENLTVGELQSLMDAGLDINGHSRDGLSFVALLLWKNGSSEVLERALKAGGNPEFYGDGYSLLDIIFEGSSEADNPYTAAALLIRYGHPLDTKSFRDLFRLALYAEELESFKNLLDSIDAWSFLQDDGYNLLCTAHFSPEGLTFLLQNGVDVNARSVEGNTILHYSYLYYDDHFDSVQTLICQGADLNAVNQAGAVPLTEAMRFDSWERITRLLIESGADLNFINRAGQSILDVARIQRRSRDFLQLLQDHGAVVPELNHGF